MNFKLLIYKCLSFFLGNALFGKFKRFYVDFKKTSFGKWENSKLLIRDFLRAIGLIGARLVSSSFYNSRSVDGRETGLATNNLEKLPDLAGLTIITLNLNSQKFIKEYLNGFATLPGLPIQLIFVDHNSIDCSVSLLNDFDFPSNVGVTFIKKDFNDTFSKSNNEALAQAKHDFVLFLNNDVILRQESQLLTAMKILHSYEEVGVVGWELYHDEELSKPQHLGISFLWDRDRSFFRPTNIARELQDQTDEITAWSFPAVTAAMALCRKQDLLSINRYDEVYNYGYEDVDLCLRMMILLGKRSVLLKGAKATHSENKSQKRDSRLEVRQRRLANQKHFIHRHNFQLRLINRRALFDDFNSYNLKRTTIGFVVTEAFDGASAGDYFTALELSIALQSEIECDVKFFPQRGKGAVSNVDCDDIEVLIVMIDRFDISKLKNRTSNTVVIAWMRNWFDRWLSWPYFDHYDIYLSSSVVAQDHIETQKNIRSEFLGIATNSDRFLAPYDSPRSTDIAFVGSRWNVPREIEQVFPLLRKYLTKIYGYGWNDVVGFEEYYQGPINYEDVPTVYSNTKIVLDDAASSTKQWQSTNSRVYDALAAGCLVITNSNSNADLDLPRYSTNEELAELLERYLSDETQRLALCNKLQKQVVENHTYAIRAAQFRTTVAKRLKNTYRIAIKVPAPNDQEKHKWGDYHFADSLMSSLKSLGQFVRLDLLDSWECAESASDDIVIVLRGLSEYKPRKDQINIMWNISHPDKISDHEYLNYDLVFVASKLYADSLQDRIPDANIKPLLQCTDSRRFFLETNGEHPEHEVLFVGNSRRIYRDVVKHSVNTDLPLSIYGGLWGELVPDAYIKGENVPNKELRKYYRGARVVLNDHWDSMRESGFISNRLFDVVASGGIAVSDHIDGMQEVFGDSVVTYRGSQEDFSKAVETAMTLPRVESDSRYILKHHTFDARAKEIMLEIDQLVNARLAGWIT